MTIYELEIPKDAADIAIAITNKAGYRPTEERNRDNEVLVRIYLRYVEAHEWQPKESRYEDAVKRWLSCGRCINKVCEYFEKRYEHE